MMTKNVVPVSLRRRLGARAAVPLFLLLGAPAHTQHTATAVGVGSDFRTGSMSPELFQLHENGGAKACTMTEVFVPVRDVLGTKSPMALPQGPNQRWSLDFVSDALASSRRFRILAVVDDFTRECLTLVADNSLSGLRVARELDRIAEFRGHPSMVVSENGTELTSHAILAWQEERGVECPTPHRASQCRTASLNRSTVGCATSASTSTCSPICRRPAG